MVQRNRAWRRRTTRNVIEKVKETKNAIFSAFGNDKKSKPYQAQKLRSRNRLDQELREASSPA
jgi:hypothetical protein